MLLLYRLARVLDSSLLLCGVTIALVGSQGYPHTSPVPVASLDRWMMGGLAAGL